MPVSTSSALVSDKRCLGALVDHARRYAEANLKVLALKPRGKVPLTKHGVKDATADPAVIDSLWHCWPNANIGLAIPRGYLVIDADSEDALLKLGAREPHLLNTSWARTARGGHFWLSASEQQVRNRVGLLPSVDIRAHGGYVVAPPSVHPTGSLYRWEVEFSWSKIAEAPAWLMECMAEDAERRAGSALDWSETIGEVVPEGNRNAALAKVAGLLFRRLPARAAAELAACWAQTKLSPPLPEREVRRTIESIAMCELRRRGGAA